MISYRPGGRRVLREKSAFWGRFPAQVAWLGVPALLVLASCAPPAPRPQAPVVKVEQEVWDFGTIERGQTAKTRLKITNKGNDSLRLLLSTSCECLSAAVDQPVVPPRGAGWLSLSFLGYEIKDVTSKTLYLDTNDPLQPRVTITVTGRVTKGRGPHLVAIPNPLPVEMAPDSSVASGSLTLSNLGGARLVIRAIRCFGCTSEWNELVLEPGEEAALRVEALPGWQTGRWLEIESNDPVWPVKRMSLVEM